MPKLPNMNELMDFEQYRIWRQRNRVRLIDVAKYCNCSVSNLSQWETGSTNLSDELKRKYTEFIYHFKKRRND